MRSTVPSQNVIKVGKITKEEKGGCPHPGEWPGLLAGAFPELFCLFCQPQPSTIRPQPSELFYLF